MPQTREHLEILSACLGLRHGIIALTKCDLVDENHPRGRRAWRSVNWCRERFLENAPIVRTSAHSGEGISELRAAIAEACRHVEARTGKEWFPARHRPVVHRAGARQPWSPAR